MLNGQEAENLGQKMNHPGRELGPPQATTFCHFIFCRSFGSGRSPGWVFRVLGQTGAARREASDASQLVIAAKLRTPFVMPAAPRDGVEPETPLGRFLPAVQAAEMFVNLLNQF